MAVTGIRPQMRTGRIAQPGLGYGYLMIGVALGSIVISGIFGSIFCPDMVTGAQHEHFAVGPVTGWVWDAIAIGIFLPVAMQGVRARVTDRVPWTMLGLGLSAIWLASMFVTIFAPVWVFGTDPDQFPFTAGIGAIAAVILTGVLSNVVKTGFFQVDEPKAPIAAAAPAVASESATDEVAAKLRQLAQLRDSTAISEADYEAKKRELLNRI